MLRILRGIYVVALAAVLGLMSGTAQAAPCAKVCRPAIAACVADGYTRSSCRRVLRASCRLTPRPHVCSYTSAPTSTTSSSTSTTTLPSLPDITGTWYFRGLVYSDTCTGAPPNVLYTIIINADGSGSIDQFLVLDPSSTTEDSGGWGVVTHSYLLSSACNYSVGVNAHSLGDPASADLRREVVCTDGTSCNTTYNGMIGRFY